MSKRILVVSRRDDRTEYDTADSMAARLNEVGGVAEYQACFLDELVFSYDGSELRVTNERTDEPVENFDLIFCMGWFNKGLFEEVITSLARYAMSKGVKVLNSETYTNRSRSKVSQYVVAVQNGLSMTPFCFSVSHHGLLKGLERSGVDYPLILKAPFAGRGRHNFLVSSREELDKILAENSEITFMIQAFVPNNGDLRLITLGGEVRMAIGRQAQPGTHLSNTSQGGTATQVDMASLPPAMLDDAVRIASLLNREIGGVDMIIHKETGQHYLLEANNMPQLSTGSFVHEKAVTLNAYFEGLVSTDT